MSSFTTPLHVSPMDDGKNWELTRSFTFRIGSQYSNQYIRVPQGRITDFASIPKIFLPLLPSWAKYSKPSPLHDELYKTKKIMGEPISRKRADDVFLEAMLIDFRHHKSGKLIAWLEYYAVRLCGWLAWKNNF